MKKKWKSLKLKKLRGHEVNPKVLREVFNELDSEEDPKKKKEDKGHD